MLVFNYQKCRAKAALHSNTHTHIRICKVRAKINKEKSKTKIKKREKKTHFFSQFKSVKPIKKRQSKNLDTNNPDNNNPGPSGIINALLEFFQLSLPPSLPLPLPLLLLFFFGFLFFIFFFCNIFEWQQPSGAAGGANGKRCWQQNTFCTHCAQAGSAANMQLKSIAT